LVKSCSFASDEYIRGIVGDETEKRRVRVLRDETNLDSAAGNLFRERTPRKHTTEAKSPPLT
jgi:hypothetical protein